MPVQISFQIFQTRVQRGEAWTSALRQCVIVRNFPHYPQTPTVLLMVSIIRIEFATELECHAHTLEF